MKRQLVYHSAPRHTLKRMDAATSARILAALEAYAATQQGDVRHLQGSDPPAYHRQPR